MLLAAVEAAIVAACARESDPGFLLVAWHLTLSTITVSLPAGKRLARCALERTMGGLVALQEQLDEKGRPLQRGYSLLFEWPRRWRRWEDNAQLTDEELGEELVAWTVRLAQEREAARPASQP